MEQISGSDEISKVLNNGFADCVKYNEVKSIDMGLDSSRLVILMQNEVTGIETSVKSTPIVTEIVNGGSTIPNLNVDSLSYEIRSNLKAIEVVDSMEFDCAKDMEIGIEKSNFGLDCSDTLAEGLKMGINRMISPLST